MVDGRFVGGLRGGLIDDGQWINNDGHVWWCAARDPCL